MIYHITTPATWQTALDKGFYETGSLQSEGFIHCCLKEQVASVVTRYFAGVEDLIMLDIDETKLISPLKYELSPQVNEFFPHVYGIIHLQAVENVGAAF